MGKRHASSRSRRLAHLADPRRCGCPKTGPVSLFSRQSPPPRPDLGPSRWEVRHRHPRGPGPSGRRSALCRFGSANARGSPDTDAARARSVRSLRAPGGVANDAGAPARPLGRGHAPRPSGLRSDYGIAPRSHRRGVRGRAAHGRLRASPSRGLARGRGRHPRRSASGVGNRQGLGPACSGVCAQHRGGARDPLPSRRSTRLRAGDLGGCFAP
jgi:hypothetical protein